jgi:glycosyltransferase involved in cell wall biosynthesis
MKIHFDNVNLGASTGPNTFASRLAQALSAAGHSVIADGTQADVSLVFIEPTGNPLAKKVVQRLDGIWFKPGEFQSKNRRIKEQYLCADGVIFQSAFDKTFIENWWGTPQSGTVIGNGIKLNPVKEITIPSLADMRATYSHIYVCSANWHPQKRLKANVQLFEHLRTTQGQNSCLIILGNNPDYRASGPHIFYAGSVSPDVYEQVYSVADWMLHLGWADHCPNVVVEALAQGTPVVCSEVGGTKELIGSYGVVLKEERTYNFELYDYDNPPVVDVTQVKSLPTRHQLDYSSIADIDISHVADRYIELFKSVIV